MLEKLRIVVNTLKISKLLEIANNATTKTLKMFIIYMFLSKFNYLHMQIIDSLCFNFIVSSYLL